MTPSRGPVIFARIEAMKTSLVALVILILGAPAALHAADAPEISGSSEAFKSRLQSTLDRHLNRLVNTDGTVAQLKGKTAEGNGALAFYLMYEMTGEPRFRKAAVELADQVLREMRATKFGVLPIKEKEKPNGTTIM